MIVEETFTLSSKNKDDNGKVGDGVYVSATTAANRRYYGVLVDQSSLKEASSMWLQDQAGSLELNRRIKVLKQQQDAKDPSSSSAGEEPSTSKSTGKHIPEETNLQEPSKTPEVPANPIGVTVTTSIAATLSTNDESASRIQGEASTLNGTVTAIKRPLDSTSDHDQTNKRFRTNDRTDQDTVADLPQTEIRRGGDKEKGNAKLMSSNDRPVQKFKYIMGQTKYSQRGEKTEDPGYRVLVATFANVEEASCGNITLAEAIEKACEEGGNYLPGDSEYYFQYEVLPTVLTSAEAKSSDYDLRTSMGFHSFLLNTPLPPWFPLSNLPVSQTKVLEMLNMKKDNSGNVTWEQSVPDPIASGDNNASSLAGGTAVSMQPRPRKRYQIGVIGGGIAGVACCQELVTLLKNAGIDYHITLFEARPRLGGRLWTDQTFPNGDKESFPIELGASWIHGIDDNPLAVLAKDAGIQFVTSSEEVQMLGKGMKRIDTKTDEKAGKLFDDLLDHAADDCWSAPEFTGTADDDSGNDGQYAVRWYASVFNEKNRDADKKYKPTKPERAKVPSHRLSSDRSIDVELGKAILNHKLGNFSKLSSEEHQMLLWNTKNIEYALGANVSDLSMKYWDADERHAFDGDHVLLKQGYSKVIEYMVESIKASAGDNFEALLNFPVGSVEYARKSTTLLYGRDQSGRTGKFVELSDACSVTCQDGSKTKFFDFLVCACPLGVLKDAVQNHEESAEKLSFVPSLPFSKVDAISNVGFGLLNKVYLTFPKAFWREYGIFKENNQCLFGNISGVNPHHYMFFDIGRCLRSGDDAPAILMSLISGQEAVACEYLSDKQIIEEVLATLRAIFSQESIPEPISFRSTRWGQDRFSRGSYTFLPPGATDQDFHLLQSPINGNGDSLLLEGSETMRLFFAGEHTTALHPSMAHGAMLSGIRAAKEVVSQIHFKLDTDKDIDRIIPLALFRQKNPETELRCSLCNKIGGQIREGSLNAFKRGARQVLVHNNCAEFSPEVEVVDSKWKNVIRAVNRGKLLNCSLCKENGATIGCTAANCFRLFHFSCSEDAGWRFDRDGKIFYCDLHRDLAQDYAPHCDRVSMKFYLSKYPSAPLVCRLCGSSDEENNLGQLLAFQFGKEQACVHESCIKYTSICDTAEVEESRMGHEYKNVFQAIKDARTCTDCTVMGATVRCATAECDKVLHVSCARKSGWNFEKRGKRFRCDIHRKKRAKDTDTKVPTSTNDQSPSRDVTNGMASVFNHNLLAQFGGTLSNSTRVNVPGNLDMGGISSMTQVPKNPVDDESDDDSDSDESNLEDHKIEMDQALDLPLSSSVVGLKKSVVVKRSSASEPWGLTLSIAIQKDKNLLVMPTGHGDESKDDIAYDVVLSINGEAVGCERLVTLRKIMTDVLKDKTELLLECIPDETNL